MSAGSDSEFVPDLRDEPIADGDKFVLAIEGFEGPLDVLLALAREQKVDITRISILALADQYLLFIQRATDLRLDVAADYLVMAAWLAYLKSKLLLPQPKDDGEPSGAELAEALSWQLRRLEAMRNAVKLLMGRPQKGIDFHVRGEGEALSVVSKVVYQVSLFDLLKSYTDRRRNAAGAVLAIRESAALYSIDEAMQRLRALVGHVPDWATLLSLLPAGLEPGLNRRSAVASTFAASLELAKAGSVVLRQDRPFGPIYIKPAEAGS